MLRFLAPISDWLTSTPESVDSTIFLCITKTLNFDLRLGLYRFFGLFVQDFRKQMPKTNILCKINISFCLPSRISSHPFFQRV